MDLKKYINSFWGRKNVSDLKSDVSDYLVKVPGTDLRFALKELENDTEALQEYKAHLVSIIQLRGAPRIPLVVIVPNDKMLISLGVIVRWQFGTPVLEDSTSFIVMSEDNRSKIYDEIKSSDETIRMLEQTNCKIVKHIKLLDEFNGRFFNAEIVYLRDLSLSYRMTRLSQQSDTERIKFDSKGMKDFFPHDKLDQGIVKAVQDGGYEVVDINNQLLLFSSELRDLKSIYANRPSSKIEFLVLPDYSSVQYMVGKTVKPFYLDMFIDSKNQFTFQNSHFTISIEIDSIDEYYSFMDGTKTLYSVSDFFKESRISII